MLLTIVNFVCYLTITLGSSLIPQIGNALHELNPRTNVWVTLARSLNTTSFCASLASPQSPFSTCLVGVPVNDSNLDEWMGKYLVKKEMCGKNKTVVDCLSRYDSWADRQLIGPEPQELEILGSLTAQACFFINVSQDSRGWEANRVSTKITVPTPISPKEGWTNSSIWCLNVIRTLTQPASGTEYPRRLPPGIFLICRNRAWSGIPSHPIGGPCTFGKLSMLMPRWHPNKTHSRVRRELSQQLDENCKDDVKLWSKAETIAASFFTPGVAAAGAHKMLQGLACWVVKQVNQTSSILSLLADDLSTVKHAILQNRAAIDFLLLAH